MPLAEGVEAEPSGVEAEGAEGAEGLTNFSNLVHLATPPVKLTSMVAQPPKKLALLVHYFVPQGLG